MKAPSVTVAIADWNAFTARYGLVLVRTGDTVNGLPEVGWFPGPGQTGEQARLAASELKDGATWKPERI
jgi:hypothetical protein